MSTEVERSQVDSGLTAASSGGAAERSRNEPDGALRQAERDEQGPGPSDGTGSEASLGSKLQENDKENEQGDAAETVKRKVVEAPPPKVNAWAKRTTGRGNISSQEKGESLFEPFRAFSSLFRPARGAGCLDEAALLPPPPAAASRHVAAAL